MAHNEHQEKAFLCVSYNILGYLGYEKVKAAFCDIPSEWRERMAYATKFDDLERARLKDALANDPEAESAIDNFFVNQLVRELGFDSSMENRRLLVFRGFNSFIVHGLRTRLKKAGVQSRCSRCK